MSKKQIITLLVIIVISYISSRLFLSLISSIPMMTNTIILLFFVVLLKKMPINSLKTGVIIFIYLLIIILIYYSFEWLMKINSIKQFVLDVSDGWMMARVFQYSVMLEVLYYLFLLLLISLFYRIKDKLVVFGTILLLIGNVLLLIVDMFGQKTAFLLGFIHLNQLLILSFVAIGIAKRLGVINERKSTGAGA